MFFFHVVFTHLIEVGIRGMRVEFLPPYSPDYNPIKEAFSKFKSLIRRDNDVILEQMDLKNEDEVVFMLHQAIFSITASDAAGYFEHAGY